MLAASCRAIARSTAALSRVADARVEEGVVRNVFLVFRAEDGLVPAGVDMAAVAVCARAGEDSIAAVVVVAAVLS